MMSKNREKVNDNMNDDPYTYYFNIYHYSRVNYERKKKNIDKLNFHFCQFQKQETNFCMLSSQGIILREIFNTHPET